MASLLFCKVCNKLCNSFDQHSEHIKSPAHMAKERKAKEFAQNGENVLSEHVMPGIQQVRQTFNTVSLTDPRHGNRSESGIPPQLFMDESRVSSQVKRSPNAEAYVMRESRGFCYVCQIDLTSYQHCRQHIDGKNHEKKLQQWKGNRDNLARSDKTNNENSSIQMLTAQYKRAECENHSKINSAQNIQNGVAVFGDAQFPHQSASVTFPHNPLALSSNAPGQQQLAATSSLVTQFSDNTSRNTSLSGMLMCKVCDAPFSCEQNAREHFAGKKHKRAMLMLSPQQREALSHAFTNDPDQTQVLKPYSQYETPSLTPKSSFPEHPDRTERGLISTENSSPTVEASVKIDDELVNSRKTYPSLLTEKTQKLYRTMSDNLHENFGEKRSLLTKKLDEMSIHSEIPYTSSISDNNLQPIYPYDNEQLSPDSTQVGMQLLQTGQMTQRSISCPSANTGQGSKSINDKSYVFDGTKGRCYVCDVDLTSVSLAQQHLNGEKHRKKSERLRLQRSHRNLGRDIPKGPSRSDHNVPVAEENSEIRQRASHLNETFYYFSGTNGYCHACKCILSSREQAAEHLTGKPHERNIEIMRLNKEGKTPSLHCEACNMTFTGEVPATQHFSSDKHKLIAKLLACGSEYIPDLENARKITDNDGITWVFCDICRKPLNTIQQLKIHQGTPGHLAERENYIKNRNVPVSPHRSRDSGLEENTCAGLSLPTIGNATTQPPGLTPMGTGDVIPDLLTYAQSPQANIDSFPAVTGQKQGAWSPSKTLSPQVSPNLHATSPLLNNTSYGGNASANPGANHGNNNEESSSFSDTNLSGCSRNTSSPGNARGSTQSEANNHPDSNRFSTQNAGLDGSLDVMKKPCALNTSRSGDRVRNIDMDKKSDHDFIQDDTEERQNNVQNITDAENFADRTSTPPAVPKVKPSEVRRSSAFPYICELCNKLMNTKVAYEAHLKGNTHRWNVTYSKAEEIDLGNVKKTMDVSIDTLFTRGYSVTKIMPRSYQVELMTKSMNQDCVIYLPTGTGKTLVSVLTMALMLEENFDRPVIFLVDKILLVIQQGRYIEKELQVKDKKFHRYSFDNRQVAEERSMKLAFVCGGMSHSQGIPLWKHDVIVTTAAYCINMLERGFIRWDQFSLAVLDEVHHCIKKHPYQKLISGYHHKIRDPARRPKILGLTASPAGKDTVEKTYEMLKKLLDTLGNATIAIPEGKNCDELKRFQSDPQLHVICVPLTSIEEDFQRHCYKYFLKCYCKIAPMSATLCKSEDSPLVSFNYLVKHFSEETLTTKTNDLLKDPEPLHDAVTLIWGAKCTSPEYSDDIGMFDQLRMHMMEFYLNVSSIATGVNFEEMEKIFNDDQENNSQQLKTLKHLEIPCDIMRQQILLFKDKETSTVTPMLEKLFMILQDPQNIDWDVRSPTALVLVQERKEAKFISRTLQQMDFVKNKQLRVTHLVGHGKGTKDDGMDVKKQKRVLENHASYNILVATSIAEEGIDIVKLGLVISMNPPSTVRALVQMRGRARKKDSHFFILCGSVEAKDKVDRLIRQEGNMLEAAKLCIAAEKS